MNIHGSSGQHREALWAGKSTSRVECGFPGTLDFVLLQVCLGLAGFSLLDLSVGSPPSL